MSFSCTPFILPTRLIHLKCHFIIFVMFSIGTLIYIIIKANMSLMFCLILFVLFPAFKYKDNFFCVRSILEYFSVRNIPISIKSLT